MRVVLIADYAMAEGGAPQVAIASALGLAEMGVDVTYVHGIGAAVDDALKGHSRITLVGLDGRDIWQKSPAKAALDGIWNREPLMRLREILAGFNPADSVVHVHQWTKFFSPSLFGVLREAGLPVFISMHDYFLRCPTGLMYRFDTGQPCTLRPLSMACLAAPCDPRSRLYKGVRVLRGLALEQALKGLDFTAVHVSQTGQQTLAGLLPPHIRQVVIENPVEVPYGPARPFTPACRKVTYCGRLTSEKGADLVAEAARAAGLPSLFIGEGPLRERILSIDPEAEITGWLDKSSVRAKIAAESLVVVAPSRWPETGPLVIAEAMSAGVPAVVSNRAGASGRVQHGQTGFVVAPEVEPLAAALRALAAPGVAQSMGVAAHEAYCRAPPSLASHAAQLVALYSAR